MTSEQLTDVTVEELANNKDLQLEVFDEMLARLEDAGKCRFAFHRLGMAVFKREAEPWSY